MKHYKIVASDLDGTLLNNQGKVSEENKKAIDELLAEGVHFVPCSGRTFSEIVDEIKENDAIRYYIHSNGAVVLDKQTGEQILTCIPNELGRKILDVVNSFETHVTYRQNGESYVDGKFQKEGDYDYYNVHMNHQRVVLDYANYLENFKEASYAADNVEVFSVYFHNYEDKIMCKDTFVQWPELRVVEADAYNLEIMNVHAGKGNALYCLADMLGISREETISIGDSDNDASVTSAAGLGLVVSNGCESLKAIADEIICSNEEHAIAYVQSHYFK